MESAAPLPQADNYKWKVLSTVIFGIFMIILDTTVVNVAFQTIREDLGGSLNNSQWVISIYVLLLGITTPLSGFLADRFGMKRIYLGGLALFALGSLMCGLAPNLETLILARGLQGIGGGLAMPLGSAQLLQAFPPKEQGMALGIFGIAALVAPAIGPILGGWLVDQDLWRVIFFINPPIAIIGVSLGIRFLRQGQKPRQPRLDFLGILFEVIGFGSILYASSIAAETGWGAPSTLTWFAVGGVGLVLFGIVELYLAKDPLLDLRLFKNRIFLNANLLGYVSTIALFGAEFLMPIYLQLLRGRTALETGLVLLPMAIAGGIFVTLSGRIYDRVGPRPLMIAGFSLLVINTWQLSRIQADTNISWIILLLILRGLALGMTVQTTFVTALSIVPPRDLPRGSSLTNATRFIFQSIGVAVLSTVLASNLSPGVQAMQSNLAAPSTAEGAGFSGLCEPAPLSSTRGGGQPLAASQQACQENIAGFEEAYQITFYAALLALLLGSFLPGWPGKWVGRQAASPP